MWEIRPEQMLGGKSVDGIYFKHSNQGEQLYAVDFMHFAPDIKTELVEELGSYKWLAVLFEEASDGQPGYDCIYHQAVLVDPMVFVNNQMKANSQGFVIKKSILGFTLIKELLAKLGLNTIDKMIDYDLKLLESQSVV